MNKENIVFLWWCCGVIVVASLQGMILDKPYHPFLTSLFSLCWPVTLPLFIMIFIPALITEIVRVYIHSI